jgi:protein-S-isoprenylcysteine O-methyltransferase Ste14
LTLVSCILWWGSELAIAILTHSRPWSIRQDRLSYWIVWFAFLISIFAALAVSKSDVLGRIAVFVPFTGYLGCLVIVAGVGIRWVAVFTLGRQFTLQVAIVKDHRLIDHGIYKRLRHPSYLGRLGAFIGFALAIENWISLLIVFTLPLAAILYRIGVEEKALLEHFGTQYEEYCKGTKKLFPGIY